MKENSYNHAYFGKVMDRSIFHNRNMFDKKTIEKMDEKNVEHFLEILETKEFKKLNWTKELSNQIKDIHAIF